LKRNDAPYRVPGILIITSDQINLNLKEFPSIYFICLFIWHRKSSYNETLEFNFFFSNFHDSIRRPNRTRVKSLFCIEFIIKFPLLSQVARRILCVQGTSSASERNRLIKIWKKFKKKLKVSFICKTFRNESNSEYALNSRVSLYI